MEWSPQDVEMVLVRLEQVVFLLQVVAVTGGFVFGAVTWRILQWAFVGKSFL